MGRGEAVEIDDLVFDFDFAPGWREYRRPLGGETANAGRGRIERRSLFNTPATRLTCRIALRAGFFFRRNLGLAAAPHFIDAIYLRAGVLGREAGNFDKSIVALCFQSGLYSFSNLDLPHQFGARCVTGYGRLSRTRDRATAWCAAGSAGREEIGRRRQRGRDGRSRRTRRAKGRLRISSGRLEPRRI